MFSGSLVAIVTPMRPDGRVDFEAWARLVDFHLENGTAGIVVGGTTGESATLKDTELRELTERACEQVRRRIPVIVGAGTSSTAATVERAGWLSELAVDALLVVTPARRAYTSILRPLPKQPASQLFCITCPRGPPWT